MTDPLPEFYLQSDASSQGSWAADTVQVEDSVSLVNERTSIPNDFHSLSYDHSSHGLDDHVQIDLDIEYHGNLRLTLSTELIINHPTPNFLILPVRMTLTGFFVKGTRSQVLLTTQAR